MRRLLGGTNGILISAATAINTSTAMTAADLNGVEETAFYIIGSSGVSAGAITIETAWTTGYTGTWASITTQTVQATVVSVVNVTGVYSVIRARISTTVANGTVDVYCIGD